MIWRLAILALLVGGICYAQTYDEMSAELKAATDKAEIHRLKARVAGAAVGRLETENLSVSQKKELRAEVLAHCADVQLGAMDLWFGDSVVSWGRLMLLDGDWKGARSLLWGQAEVLQNIEKNLAANGIPVSAISPVAGCRYGLGETYRLEYEQTHQPEAAVEALKHFYNVYIKYGDSPWGMLAQQKAEQAKAIVEGQGMRVRIELGEHRRTFVANKFKTAARLTAEGKHADALDQYLDAINFYPESEKTFEALRNMGVCFLKLDRHAEALMTVEYLCERFSGNTNAPLAVLGIGRNYIDAGDGPRGERMFECYLAAFPSDPRRNDILSYFAWKAYKAELWPEAVVRFQALEAGLRTNGETGKPLEKAVYIQATHPNDPQKLDRFTDEFPESDLVPDALGRKAQAMLMAGDFDGAFKTLETLGERFPEASAARTALAGLIVSAVEAERFDIAGQVLDRMLEEKQAYGYDVYIATGEGLLSAGRFALAAKAFDAVPPSAKKEQIERACHGKAAALFGQEQFGECLAVSAALLAKYPSCGFFSDARLMQARALVRLNRAGDALAAYGEVLAVRQDYAVVLEMVPLMADAEERLAAYQRIALLADPDVQENRSFIAESILASLPLCIELGKFPLAIENCDQFAGLFPKHEKLPLVTQYRKEAADAQTH
jgi:tetratricopeptide (TPR) repeat protein